jgi:hypothetical protein
VRFQIALVHNLNPHCEGPDIIITRAGKVLRQRPTSVPSSIAVDVPGLKPTAEQLLYHLVKNYQGISYSGDSVILDQPLMAMKRLYVPANDERGLPRKGVWRQVVAPDECR